MSILIDAGTRVVVQGATGRAGQYHTRLMAEYGTKVVAGVSRGKGGSHVCGIPVFDTVGEAVRNTDAQLSVCFVAGDSMMDALIEAADAGIQTVVAMAEFVPVHDIVRALAFMRARNCWLVGPNTNGLISPGKAKAGFFPTELARAGRVGIMSRSGTLAYAASSELLRYGLGQSTVVGIGGGTVRGVGFAECLRMFEDDPETDVVVLLGEVGGTEEESAADYLDKSSRKPVVALVVGRCAIPGVPMGHAGALLSTDDGSVEAKVARLRAAGAEVAETIEQLGPLVAKACQGGC